MEREVVFHVVLDIKKKIKKNNQIVFYLVKRKVTAAFGV